MTLFAGNRATSTAHLKACRSRWSSDRNQNLCHYRANRGVGIQAWKVPDIAGELSGLFATGVPRPTLKGSLPSLNWLGVLGDRTSERLRITGSAQPCRKKLIPVAQTFDGPPLSQLNPHRPPGNRPQDCLGIPFGSCGGG